MLKFNLYNPSKNQYVIDIGLEIIDCGVCGRQGKPSLVFGAAANAMEFTEDHAKKLASSSEWLLGCKLLATSQK